MLDERFFDDAHSMQSQLLGFCAEQLRHALASYRDVSFFVSGGSTPKVLYEALSYEDVNWSQVAVALVDERWVDRGESGSNTEFLHETLLKNRAAQARFVPMKNSAVTPLQGLAQCEAAYQTLPEHNAITVLGMGDDGHTASLFPYAEGLVAAMDRGGEKKCGAITASPSSVTGDWLERMTLTLPALLSSRQIVLLIRGEAKRAVYEQAKHAEDFYATPVAAVLQQQQCPVTVFWCP